MLNGIRNPFTSLSRTDSVRLYDCRDDGYGTRYEVRFHRGVAKNIRITMMHPSLTVRAGGLAIDRTYPVTAFYPPKAAGRLSFMVEERTWISDPVLRISAEDAEPWLPDDIQACEGI